jgi:hypothetical protein
MMAALEKQLLPKEEKKRLVLLTAPALRATTMDDDAGLTNASGVDDSRNLRAMSGKFNRSSMAGNLNLYCRLEVSCLYLWSVLLNFALRSATLVG